MITIDGYKIPSPSTYVVSIQDISKAERNANGDIIIERIATKRKIELAYPLLSQEELQFLLQRVSPVFFEVVFIDPEDGGQRTGTFYCGDRSTGALDLKGGKIRWRDIKFNLIEK